MVLPLPVKPGTGEQAIKFIDLKEYSEFFDDLKAGFPAPATKRSFQKGESLTDLPASTLEVVQVGNFEASFVPTVKDFSRLDERFRLPPGTWQKLPIYEDYGFAVFKLKKGEGKIHPMAFSFPRRKSNKIFFPTVHIHDGEVRSQAEFDHALFCQPRENQHLTLSDWRESPQHARSFMKAGKAKGIIEPDQHCYSMPLRGELPNKDTFIDVQV